MVVVLFLGGGAPLHPGPPSAPQVAEALSHLKKKYYQDYMHGTLGYLSSCTFVSGVSMRWLAAGWLAAPVADQADPG